MFVRSNYNVVRYIARHGVYAHFCQVSAKEFAFVSVDKCGLLSVSVKIRQIRTLTGFLVCEDGEQGINFFITCFMCSEICKVPINEF